MKTIKRIAYLSLILLLVTSFVCKAQESTWSVKDGWVMKSNPDTGKEEKFFAIGLWGVPGYTFNKLSVEDESDKYPDNKDQFLNKIKHFNLFYIQLNFGKEYMNNVMKMAGTIEIPWFLKEEYFDKKGDSNEAYYMMRRLVSEKKSKSTRLQKTINTAIDYTLREVKDSKDFIWAPFDEIATGYQSWAWPSEVTDMVYDEIKNRTPNKLVYIDLLGSSSPYGNTFLFEQYYYNKRQKKLPPTPPFYALQKTSKRESLNDFFVTHEGKSIMENRNGVWRIDEMPTKDLENIWHENVKLTAKGYKKSGDIFGINSFQHLRDNPKLAGVTVEAIKKGAGEEAPVWLFFDSNGYAKPSLESTESYIRKIKCQIYTSIVHGATGVLFWSDLRKDDTVFNSLIPVIKELKKYEHIFYMETINENFEGDIRYIIKKGEKQRYLIAVNTSGKNKVLDNRDIKRTLFKPYEVKVKTL